MKRLVYLFLLGIFVFISCNSESSHAVGGQYDATRFSILLDSLENEQLVDVRTPGEYAEGHIRGAQNIDWNANDFASLAGMLDRKKPVMVYCLAGGRSHEAAKWLSENGFDAVYELEGGVRSWSVSGMPLEKESTAPVANAGEVTTAAFASKVNQDKVVLADFGATWCGPCKMLAPRLEELDKEMAGKFELVKLDADRDAKLSDSMNITALPTLFLYKNGKLLWRNEGLVPKELVASKINEAIATK